jgi:hypothetical protein
MQEESESASASRLALGSGLVRHIRTRTMRIPITTDRIATTTDHTGTTVPIVMDTCLPPQCTCSQYRFILNPLQRTLHRHQHRNHLTLRQHQLRHPHPCRHLLRYQGRFPIRLTSPQARNFSIIQVSKVLLGRESGETFSFLCDRGSTRTTLAPMHGQTQGLCGLGTGQQTEVLREVWS